MTAGELNTRLTVEVPTRVKNDLGESIVVWNETARVWASVNPLTANEQIKVKQAQLTLTHKIRCRYTSVIKSDCRLVYQPAGEEKPRYLNIQGIINIGEKNRELEITAVEIKNG